tara:strand:+ start:254 stop:463 length:210 start_codon:yes stop_codon:yes gene_type:complete
MNIGDLVTLKGMSSAKEKPLGIITKKWATKHLEIFWLNKNISKRYALTKVLSPTKIEIVNSVYQQSHQA